MVVATEGAIPELPQLLLLLLVVEKLPALIAQKVGSQTILGMNDAEVGVLATSVERYRSVRESGRRSPRQHCTIRVATDRRHRPR